MILEPGMNILRVHTLKRLNLQGRYEVFQNRHDFLYAGDFNEFYAQQTIDRVALAEQHLLMPEVEILFQVGYWFSPFNVEGSSMKAAALFRRQNGGRTIDAGDTVVEFPLALLMRRMTASGRAGRLMFRGMLRERDLRRDTNGHYGLKGDYEGSGVTMTFFNSFMRETPYPAVVCDFAGESLYPTGARVIQSWEASQATRLSSVAQAQLRKTMQGASYRQQAHDLADKVTLAGQFFSEVLLFGGEDIPFAAVEQLIELLRAVGIAAQAIQEYWKSGLDENFAPCWRPGAGLDPYSLDGRNSLEKMVSILAQLLGELAQLEPGELGTVPRDQVQRLYPLMERAAVSYALMLERVRFTGTPIPHPNVAGACLA